MIQFPTHPAPKPVDVCATCPFRLANQGKPHPANWYSLKNLRRIWNGIRTGAAPGFTCHASDPESKNYGSTVQVPDTCQPRECGGLLIVVQRHVRDAGESTTLKEYRGHHRYPMTRAGIAHWVNRALFGSMNGSAPPDVACPNPEKVGLPWDRQ